jgi:hypothetical protein
MELVAIRKFFQVRGGKTNQTRGGQKFGLAKFLLISCRRQIFAADPHRLRQPKLMKEFSWAR